VNVIDKEEKDNQKEIDFTNKHKTENRKNVSERWWEGRVQGVTSWR